MVSYRWLIGHVLVGAILWSQLATVSPAQQGGTADQRGTTKDDAALGARCTLSSDTLVSREWRLYSEYFQVQPNEGFQFRFLSDGRVESKNLALITRWQIEADGTVTLQDQDGREARRFRLDGEYCVLAAFDCENERSVPMLLGPKGTDFFGYLVKRCPRRFQRVGGKIGRELAP
jgi:hypothetical protein